ncbi:MAG: glutamate-5-semialdehyde dehydrogenase [Myxococcaceae bacterium]|nr:glutamate-5-semialdehyde dehydrogenase [Myxococcaceae bacterium]
MAELSTLHTLPRGTRLLFAGDQLITVPDDIADRFVAGDAVMIAEATREVLLIPARERSIAKLAVDRALSAFETVQSVSDECIARFFHGFAHKLADEAVWRAIEQANASDVASAKQRGRSTTRLVADEPMRRSMIDGLRGWTEATSRRGQVLETVQHEGFRAELVGAPLGVVAFVFEGRPNVLADATGVLRSGNTVVFRIGSDALGTARCIMETALRPALREAGLPEHSVGLIESQAHASGWALFADKRLGLAVARGSGPAVATLGSLAQQAGVPVSLHGTGGAWIVSSHSTDARDLEAVVRGALDRKVCNTLNVLCILRARAAELVPAALAGIAGAGAARGRAFKLHVLRGSEAHVPAALFTTEVDVVRAEGIVREPQAELLEEAELAHEWEWEDSPELTLLVVDSVAAAVELFNRYSPQFIAGLLSSDASEQKSFYDSVNAPFVSDGPTRWVDGQKALRKPELGLSNWQFGRLFGRGGILTGDGVLTVRTRAIRS